MPGAAAGAVFTLLATTATGAAATALGSTVLVGAAASALVGAVSAAIQGKNIIKGALTGALMGGLASYAAQGLGLGGVLKPGATPTSGGTPSTPGGGAGLGSRVGVGEAGIISAQQTGVQPTAAEMSKVVGAPTPGVPTPATSAVTPTVPAPATSATVPTVQAPSKGILSRAGQWIEKNPASAAILAQGVGGFAKGMADEESAEKELEYLMERDRLNLASREIEGLSAMEFKTVLPSVGAFTQTPKWQQPSGGLISQWQQKGNPNARATS